MIFKEEFKIFQYHFPGNPIFPGALTIDYIKNCLLKTDGFNCTVSTQFLSPVLPNRDIEFKVEHKDSDTLVGVLDKELVCTKFKLQKASTNTNPSVFRDSLFKGNKEKKKYKPVSNSSKEITFLDHWFIFDKGDDITAVGEFNYKSCCLDFLSEIGQADNFGLDFMLIEFMSLTVLSSLTNEGLIRVEDNYGFARLNNYWSMYDLNNGDDLTAVVNSSIVSNGILWNGYVLKDGRVIASMNQGIDLPLKEKG
jgi:hypothetical protein